MAHTHEFDCIICGAHLDSRNELDKHNATEHTVEANPRASSPQGTEQESPRGDPDRRDTDERL